MCQSNEQEEKFFDFYDRGTKGVAGMERTPKTAPADGLTTRRLSTTIQRATHV